MQVEICITVINRCAAICCDKPFSSQLSRSLISKKSAAWHNGTVLFINLLELHHTEKKNFQTLGMLKRDDSFEE
jgi:hypothetical protein